MARGDDWEPVMCRLRLDGLERFCRALKEDARGAAMLIVPVQSSGKDSKGLVGDMISE